MTPEEFPCIKVVNINKVDYRCSKHSSVTLLKAKRYLTEQRHESRSEKKSGNKALPRYYEQKRVKVAPLPLNPILLQYVGLLIFRKIYPNFCTNGQRAVQYVLCRHNI